MAVSACVSVAGVRVVSSTGKVLVMVGVATVAVAVTVDVAVVSNVGLAVGVGTSVVGASVGVGVSVGISGSEVLVGVGGTEVFVAVAVSVGEGSTVLVAIGVRVGTLGTYNRIPAWIKFPVRQFAVRSCETLTPNAWLNRNRLSLRWTVYCTHPGGAPQGIVVGSGGMVKVTVGVGWVEAGSGRYRIVPGSRLGLIKQFAASS